FAQHLLSEPDLLKQPHRIEPLELDLQLVFDSRLDAAVRQKPIARGLRRVVDLVHARAVARLRLQLERGLEEVDVQPRRRVQLGQGFGGLTAAQAAIADQPPHDGTVLLFHPGLVVLLVGPRARLLEAMPLTVVEDALAHEGAVVIRVHAEHREGQNSRHLVEGFDNQHLFAHPHGYAFGPAAGDVRQREGVDELTFGLHAATVLDHVDLEVTGRRIAPVGEGAHRDAASNRRAYALAALALPVDVPARSCQYAIDGRRADLQDLGLDDRVQVEMAMALHGVDQHRDQRLQALATDP